MAECVVSFIVQKLSSLIEQEIGLLKNVRQEMIYIKYEFESIKALLKDADAKGESEQGELVKVWLREVRHAAFDIEDILDDYLLRHHSQQLYVQGHGTCGFVNNLRYFCKYSMERHDLATRIQDLTIRVENVSRRKGRYNLINLNQVSIITSVASSTGITGRDPRADALFLKESELVGIIEPRDKLVSWLIDNEDLKVGVVSVFGPGGLGKTTLVKKVYEYHKVKTHFAYRVWITVSQTYEIKSLLLDLISQAVKEKERTMSLSQLKNMGITQLKEVLHNHFQQKRYVIVLDDVWKMDALKDIKCALPDTECGSRIILTTRSHDIANACVENSGCSYELQLLKPNDARKLFEKVAFKSNVANYSTQRMRELSQRFLDKCKGLPLAIAAIAGLLSTKTAIEWEYIYENSGSLLQYPQLSDLNTILSLSYNDLPYHLKSCMLYFCNFPEDYWISSSRLLRLWVAEGFVEPETRLGTNISLTMEEVAETYLNQLIARSLVQVRTTRPHRKVTACGVHDLLHEFLLKKARDQDFVAFFEQESDREIYGDRVRRLSIRNKERIVKGNVLPKDRDSFAHVRSLLAFGERSLFSSSIISMFLLERIRLLKVLDLEGAPLQELPGEVLTNLLFLKYLSLKNSNVTSLPSTLGKLVNLETLNLKHTKLVELPVEILELKGLRHLLTDTARCPEGIGRLSTLEKLGKVYGNIGKELGMLNRLRSLYVYRMDEENARNVFASIEKMKYLRSCRLFMEKPREMVLRGNSICPPLLLQRLTLQGLLEGSLDWIFSLENLTTLRLYNSKIKEFKSFFEGIQVLPNLVLLVLKGAFDRVEELYFKMGGFPSLKELQLRELNELKQIRIEEGAMPCIYDLWLQRCEKLTKLFGIEHLTSLYQIDFDQGTNKKLLNQMINHSWKRGHFPMIMSGNTKWWRNKREFTTLMAS